MAKLSAHGRELMRATLETDAATADLGNDVVWKRTTHTLHTDGVLLEKRDIRWAPNTANARYGSDRHTWGWKVRGKVKAATTLAGLAAKYERHGWTVEVKVHPSVFDPDQPIHAQRIPAPRGRSFVGRGW